MNKSNPKIHNVRFYKPKAKAVYCLALSPIENKLAASRSDASLEIWNLDHSPFIERTIASSTENFSVEGLAWSGSRLFSVGLHGLLIEYDLFQLNVKSRSVVTGEAAFCLDIKNNSVAIGTEQGYLNIFQITDEEVLFEKFLDKQEGRILCLKYDSSGDFIVSGSTDALRIWSVKTGQALHKMVTGRSEQNKPTIVWCLAVTQEFTIISGDSRGVITVWDGKVGAQVESYQSHQSDILAICLSNDENELYCAGVDPNIVDYVKIRIKNGTYKWVRSLQRKIHDHDVRALALSGKKLYSSGIDGYLACSYHPPKTLLKFPPIVQYNSTYLARKSRRIMLRHRKHLEIWSLGESGEKKDKHTGLYTLDSKPKKLAVVHRTSNTEEGEEKKEGIVCAAISDNGDLILYSTRLGARLLKFDTSTDRPGLIPLEIRGFEGSCVSAIFAPNDRLVLAHNKGGLEVVAVDSDDPRVIQSIATDSKIKDTITILAVSSTAQFLVGADCRSNVVVWCLDGGEYKFYCTLPRYEAGPTALAIHHATSNLVVAYANNNIIEYSLVKRQLTKFSRTLLKNLPKNWMSRTSVIRNISFDPRADNIIVLHDDDGVIVIDKEKITRDREAKSQKLEEGEGEQCIRIIKKYKHLVHLSWLSDDEMVAVEVNPLGLIEHLPPCFVQNTFGRK